MKRFKLLTGKKTNEHSLYDIPHIDEIINEVIDHCEGFLCFETIPDSMFEIQYGIFKLMETYFRASQNTNIFRRPLVDLNLKFIFQPHSGPNFVIHLIKTWDKNPHVYNGDMRLAPFPCGIELTQEDLNDY